jgi:hypothetical protein
LQPGPQLAFSKKDPAQLKILPDDLCSESAYFTGTRKSPFLWPRTVEPIPGAGSGPTPGGGTGTNTSGNGPAQPTTSHSPEKFYNFAGVVIHDGTAHALLQVRGKPVTIRAEEGATIDGGYSVTRVNKQSIELQHANGKRYLLRDRSE